MLYSDSVILVFAKAPVAGTVNTRLIPDIGEQAATDLQYEMIHHRLAMLTQAQLCDVVLMCAPDIEHEVFRQCEHQYPVRLMPQVGSDLGDRMFSGVRSALTDYSHCIVVGTDAPALDTDKITRAIDKIRETKKNVVFVPAEDGGYVLLGMSQPLDILFTDISWGSEAVMQQSRNKLDEAGVPFIELDSCWDIDCVEDYQRYLDLKK